MNNRIKVLYYFDFIFNIPTPIGRTPVKKRRYINIYAPTAAHAALQVLSKYDLGKKPLSSDKAHTIFHQAIKMEQIKSTKSVRRFKDLEIIPKHRFLQP